MKTLIAFQFEPGHMRPTVAHPGAPGQPESQVTPGGHRLLSEGVWLGRDFRADEDQPDKQYVVLLSHRLWRERFGADPDIIGRDIRMDAVPSTVVGVLAPGWGDRTPANVWIPISLTPGEVANRHFRPLIVDG